jgi:hypothetical protein
LAAKNSQPIAMNVYGFGRAFAEGISVRRFWKGESTMTNARKMLLETLAGHIALLQSSHPEKANTIVAKRAEQYVKSSLKICSRPKRLAA